MSDRGNGGDIRNGALLYRNHHTLFDEFAWTPDEDLRVLVADDDDFRRSAAANCVLDWEGKRLSNLPSQHDLFPATEAVRYRLERFERARWSTATRHPVATGRGVPRRGGSPTEGIESGRVSYGCFRDDARVPPAPAPSLFDGSSASTPAMNSRPWTSSSTPRFLANSCIRATSSRFPCRL